MSQNFNLSTTTCYDKIKRLTKDCLLVCVSNAHVRHWNVVNLLLDSGLSFHFFDKL